MATELKIAGISAKATRLAIALTALTILWSNSAWSALTVELVNGYNLVVDSNVTSPATYGPASAYIGARICNTGSSAIEDVTVYVGDYANADPGTYPVEDTDVGDWSAYPFLENTGQYSLTHEADAADATRYIGNLNANACRIEYWLISYPRCVNVDGQGQYPPCDVSIAGGIKPDDDLTLEYDIWATTSTTGVSGTNETGTLTMRNEISASANKIWPNTTSKVPDEYLDAIVGVLGWGTLGPDGRPLEETSPVYPGQRVITTQGIWYDLGNVGHGFDNDGDFVPDKNAWLQPVGDPGKFDADCFRMVGLYGVLVVKLKSGGEELIPFVNQLYFMNVPENTGAVGLVYYQFIPIGEACSAAMTPYQEAASGFDNEKFSADFGFSLGLSSGSYGNDLLFSKSDGVASVAPGGTLTYTITAPNGTGVNLGAPDLSLPLVFVEHIPTGTSYVAGSADDGLTPPSGTGSYSQGYTDADGDLDTCTINYSVTDSSYKIRYSIDDGDTWVLAEPSPASDVTDIQWMLTTTLALDGGHDGTDCITAGTDYDNGVLETSLPAGKTASVQFQVDIDGVTGPFVCNTARLTFGAAASGPEATDCTLVTGNNSLSGTVFEDDAGTTGTFGNGTQDGDEDGIGDVDANEGVSISLYYDLNDNGEYDSEDIQYGSSQYTDASGDYSFSNLPDGPYFVVAKKYDGDATGDGAINAVHDIDMGWGNTTEDPNLALTTDQGILKMTENSTSVTLAVNIDLDGNNSTAQSITDVDFGFAPPLVLTKRVEGNASSVDEGDVFDYNIVVENRLPSVGRQGPTGCEYTVWAADTYTGNNTKAFDIPENAEGSPDRATASAEVSNGGLRWIYGTNFNIPSQNATITKVEALFFGYFSSELSDDFLTMTTRNASDDEETGTISTAQIESYVGEPADLDPNSAITWNISTKKPDGIAGDGVVGDWNWSDFSTLELEVNPDKSAAGDQKTFYLDAVGLRVTVDCDCESSDYTTLNPVPLKDTYDAARFTFISADPTPTSVNESTGVVEWDNIGPVFPGTPETITVTVQAEDVDGTVTGTCTSGSEDACNEATTAHSSIDLKYSDGRLTSDASDDVPVDIVGKGEINGYVFNDDDTTTTGWNKDSGDTGLPGVHVTLYACVQSDGSFETDTPKKTCVEEGGTWQSISTTTTDENGYYEFIGLDQATYIVEVGDTDGSPANGNASPFNGTQAAEAYDSQAVSGGNATGQTCGACDNTWGNPAYDLDQFNQINNSGTEESIAGVNFGYSIPATIYGNVWHDIDGDSNQDAGESGLSGFTVQLYDDTDNDGAPDGSALSATTTDSSGNYSFTGLSIGNYVAVATPPTLANTAWKETDETTISPETGNLNNQIRVSITGSAEFSGSHDFGYTLEPTSNIGDTLYYDFDGDGAQDTGEDGIPNVTINLYEDIDRDGNIDVGTDTIIATDVTDGNGEYLFEDLPYGSYVVKVDTTDTDFPTDVSATGDPDTNSASIGDYVWFDANGDGIQDSGEKGIPEVVVRLYEDTDGNGSLDTGTDKIVAAVTTDLNGMYLFTRLNEGYYWVDIDENTLPSADLALTTSDPIGTRQTIGDRTGTAITSADAGYSPGSNYAMGGRIWSDSATYGTMEAGEAGIGDVEVTVQLTSCYPSCATKYTATTEESGFWMVTGIANGAYTISVDRTNTLPTGFYRTNAQGDGDTRTRTVSGADVMNIDFGYAYNPDNDADYAEHASANPVSSITGRVFRDANGDGAYQSGEEMSGTPVLLYDDDGNLIGTTSSASDGTYSFDGVSIGIYMAEAIDRSGNYTTVFLAAGSNYSDLDLIYDPVRESTADSESAVAVDGVYDDLSQDFGYRRFTSSIGDTIYLDINENADQDFGDPGIGNVTVKLFLWTDSDGDGEVDSGEYDSGNPVQTEVTTTDDPITEEDEGGKYLFTNLTQPASNYYYLVQVDTSTLPGTATLIGDPDTDGVPCTDSPAPDGCDSQQAVTAFVAGNNYLGADFGYGIVAAGYAAFGDTVWIDADDDGVKDSGEPGIPYITIYIDEDDDDAFEWSDGNGNGEWDSGEGERWVTTDMNGNYSFTGLPDGTYSYVKVLTSDADWPGGVSTTPSYEVRDANDGSLDSTVDVVITGGAVTAIVDGDGDTTDTCSNCGTSVDFGYRYSHTNTLAGTIGIDDSTENGYLGDSATDYSGVDSANGESSLEGIQVNFLQWNDNDNDNVAFSGSGYDAGDTFTYLGSASTDANGDYSYANLPAKVVVTFGILPQQSLLLTTTQSNTSVESATSRQFYSSTDTYDGNTVTVLVRQALSLGGNTVDVDFAFDPTLGGAIEYDWGDLPNSYTGTLLSDNGAVHRVNSSSIRLGSAVSTETDGKPGTNANLDTNDDGVVLTPGGWYTGVDGASVTVTASKAGWLIGWVDFNNDGKFVYDDDERIINQAVASGDNTISFFVPEAAKDYTSFFARFRIYPGKPSVLSYKGKALDVTFKSVAGEVEDYNWTGVTVTYASIYRFEAYPVEGSVVIEWETGAEIGTAGFVPMVLDDLTGEYVQVGAGIVPSVMSTRGGVYRCVDQYAEPGGSYSYKIVELGPSGERRQHGPYEVSVEDMQTQRTSLPETLSANGIYRKAHDVKPSGLTRREALVASSQLPYTEAGGLRSFERKKTLPRGSREVAEETGLKLYTENASLFQVNAADIAALGGVSADDVTARIASRQIILTSRGEPVAYLPYSDNSGLYFYGEKLSTLFTDHNVYWLSNLDARLSDYRGDLDGDGEVTLEDLTVGLGMLVGAEGATMRTDYEYSDADVNANAKVDMAELTYISEKINQETSSSPVATGAIMKTVSGGSPESAAPPQSQPVSIHLEQERWSLTDYFFDPRADYWIWDYVIPNVYSPPDFEVYIDGVADGAYTAELTVYAQGFYSDPGPVDHHAIISVNGTKVGDIQWDGLAEAVGAFSFDQNLLQEGANSIRVEGILGSGVGYSVFAIDGFDLSYQRTYASLNNALTFNSSFKDLVTVTGFSGPDVMVFELADAKNPLLVTDTLVDQDALGKYRVTFVPPSNDTEYLAVLAEAAKSPSAMDNGRFTGLKDPNIECDYLIITSPALETAAQALAIYRRQTGLSSQVATLTEIFDQFNDGIYSPDAIAEFISYAKGTWTGPPKYVVLAGDGTYDYKNILGRGDNVVPAILTGTPDGLFAADCLYVDTDNDGVPNLPIGRLPALSNTELQTMVHKIVSHESGASVPLELIEMVADEPEENADFPFDSDLVAELIPTRFSTDRIYLDSLTVEQARQRIFDGINTGGAFILNYIGHGSYDSLSNSSLLRIEDAESMINEGRYPVLTAFTCLAGGFDFPGFETFSEVMVQKEGGGFVAAWSPSGMSINEEAILLNQYLFEAMFEENIAVFGDAILFAVKKYADERKYVPMIQIYNLLGDPALNSNWPAGE